MTKRFASILLPVAFASLASTAAFAQEATPDYPQAVTSSVSRAEIRAQAIAARDAGLVAIGEIGQRHVQPQAAGADRVRVQAELGEARRLGLIVDGERSAEATQAQLESVRAAGDRAAVTRVAGR
jgi:hypothetical protein